MLQVVYNEYRGALALRGTSRTSTSITVRDAESGASIGRQRVQRGDWRAVIGDVDFAPDSVIVQSNTGCTAQVDVRVFERKSTREHDEEEGDRGGSGSSSSHPFGWSDPRDQHPDYVSDNGVDNCLACHSIASADRGKPMSCYNCHGQEWDVPQTQPPAGGSGGHPFGWSDPRRQHPDYVGDNGVDACLACHSIASADRGKPMSCYNCHGQEWDVPQTQPPAGGSAGHPFGWSDPRRQHPDYVGDNGVDACLACHSIASADRGKPMSCYNCHGQEWDAPETQPPAGGSGGHPFGWSDPRDQHPDYVGDNGVDACLACHSIASADRGKPMSCYNCHGQEWDAPQTQPPAGGSAGHPFGWSDPRDEHPDYVSDNGIANCLACHSIASADRGKPMSCYNCHGQEWDAPETQPPAGGSAGHPFGWSDPRDQHPDYVEDNGVGACLACHSTASGDRGKPMSCYNCHGQEW